MRFGWPILLTGLLAGCTRQPAVTQVEQSHESAAARQSIRVENEALLTNAAGNVETASLLASAASGFASPFYWLAFHTEAANVPDLRTRKTGIDWPTFLGPHRQSTSPETGIIAPWPKKGLRIVWQREIGTGYGMPVISKGRLFHFDRVDRRRQRAMWGFAQFGGFCSLTPHFWPNLVYLSIDPSQLVDTARLTCLKSETGEFLWDFHYPTFYEDDYGYNNGPRCSPVVDGDRVYIYGVDGMLVCLNAVTGKKLWQIDTVKRFNVVKNFFGVGSTPIIEGDLLIAQVGGSPKGEVRRLNQKSNHTAVVAFDKYTGKVKYAVGDDLASYSSPVIATIGKKRWCFVLARGGLIGMEPATGKIRFHFPWRAKIFESVNASCPVVVGDHVFISETYGAGSALLKIVGDSYKVVWSDANNGFRNKIMECHWNTPIYHEGYLYGCSGRHSHNAVLRCIELATGKIMWSEPNLTRSSLLKVDGHFVCMSENGHLRLLKINPKKYEEVSHLVLRRETPDSSDDEGDLLLRPPCWEAPILAHGLLYVRGADRLVCLELIPQR